MPREPSIGSRRIPVTSRIVRIPRSQAFLRPVAPDTFWPREQPSASNAKANTTAVAVRRGNRFREFTRNSLAARRRVTVVSPLIAGRRRKTYVRVLMIELTLLGLQSVRGSDGREFGSLLAQPKRFALLAYLTVAGRGGCC